MHLVKPAQSILQCFRVALFLLLSTCWGISFAASTGSGRAYGLEVNASVLGAGLGVPVADTDLRNAPPDFDVPASVLNAGVNAGLLSLSTGAIQSSTQSVLAQNSVVSKSSIAGLDLSVLTLGLGAGVITSEARMTCQGGIPVGSGSTGIVGGTGLLSGVSVAANSIIPVSISIPGVANIGATIYINEQSQVGNKMSVNALRVEINVTLIVNLLSASVTVGHTEAKLDDCKPTVTLAPLPVIGVANQVAVPISGTCSAGSGNVKLTSVPTGIDQLFACSTNSTFQGTTDAHLLPDGPVTLTASQTASGQVASASQSTTKSANSVSQPVVTVDSAPLINVANQSSYGVSGTCSANGTTVNVLIGSVSSSSNCSGSVWSIAGINVSSLLDGAITVSASQTVSGQIGNGSRTTTKDATPPTVAITSAPNITSANQSSYVVSGTCSENGLAVSVSIGGIPALPAPTCNGGTWTAPGIDVGSLPIGPVTVSVSQIDSAGNVGNGTLGTTKQDAQSAVTVTSAPVINIANQAAYGGVAGACSTSSGTVNVTIGSIGANTICSGGSWSVSGVNVTALPDGSVKITASQTISGSVVSGSRVTIKDALAPSVSIVTAPTIDETNQASYGASGTCTTGDGVVSVQIGSIPVTANCVDGVWPVSGIKVGGLPQGNVTITASQTDAVGNTGSSTRQVVKTTKADGSIDTGSDPVSLITPQNGTWIISAELNGEPGRGMGIDVQDGILFMQVYNYLSTGAPTFHTAVGKLKDNAVTAPLLFYKGGRFFGSGDISGQEAGTAGEVKVTFTSRTTGTIQFPGENALPMQRYDFEGTPANAFGDPSLVDRWAIVELNSDNRPRSVWWADIGTSAQVKLNYDWTGSTRAWPFSDNTLLTLHGFAGTLAAPIFAACDYSGANRMFRCTGDSVSEQGQSNAVALTLERSLDQLSGTMQVANGETRRIIGTRVTRAGYQQVSGQTERVVYFPAHSAPESGTWVISSELNGKAGRGMTLDQQTPANATDRKLFLSLYDYNRDGNATFHSAFGSLEQTSSPDLELIQYAGGRYFGSSDRVAKYLDSSGKVAKHSYISPVLGTIQFPGEEEVLNERYYFGVEQNSVNSLVGSWVVLSSKTGVKSMVFNFVPFEGDAVIDQTTGYVCVREDFREFDFRCASRAVGSTDPAIRFTPAYFSASNGIIGDGEAVPSGAAAELTIWRVRDANGQLIQSGPLFPK